MQDIYGWLFFIAELLYNTLLMKETVVTISVEQKADVYRKDGEVGYIC